MKALVFEVDKENKFRRVHILKDETIEGAEKRLIKVNEDAGFNKAYVVKDQHVIDAIIGKESEESLRKYSKDIDESIKDAISNFEEHISNLGRQLDMVRDYIDESIVALKEEKAGAN